MLHLNIFDSLHSINWNGNVAIHYNDVIMGAMASQITSLTIVYSTVYSGWDQRKHQSSAPLAFVWEFTDDRRIPHTKASNAANVSIWWRHHVWLHWKLPFSLWKFPVQPLKSDSPKWQHFHFSVRQYQYLTINCVFFTRNGMWLLEKNLWLND